MSAAKVISVVARPSQTAYLCFEVGGILDWVAADLGVTAEQTPYGQLCDAVKSSPVTDGDPSRLRFDAAELSNLAGQFSMAQLRCETSKAALDTAVNTRQNVYFSKYAASSQVISNIRGSYSKTSPTSKPNLLEILEGIAEQQATALRTAYMEDDRTGVVKATSSTVETRTEGSGESERFSNFTQESRAEPGRQDAAMPAILPDLSFGGRPGDVLKSNRAHGTRRENSVLTAGYNYEFANGADTATGKQWAQNTDFEYRTPYLEADARGIRAHISLGDQRFDSYMLEQNMPYLEQIFTNELASIDNSVYQYQLALLRSFLVSPIAGIVTGIYKCPGDAVGAGEPVLRVENNDVVRLVADIVHRGPLLIGSNVKLTTRLYGPSSPATTTEGEVVAFRGQGDRDRWEVVVRVENVDESGNHILPLDYCFDREYTDITVM